MKASMNNPYPPIALNRLQPARLVLLFALSALLGANPSSASNPGESPVRDNTISTESSGLIWKRCAEGQTWSGSGCAGFAKSFTLAEAQRLAREGWRLPTIAELLSIAKRDNVRPAIDKAAFPNTPSENFWAATTYADQRGLGWAVNFRNGANYASKSAKHFHVRLVRDEQPRTSSAGGGQDISFDDMGGGNLTDSRTGLTWKRCAEGQSWAGSACLGAAGSYSWAEARKLALDGWRIPDADELLTLVEWTKSRPAIDTANFPGTPSAPFWSASPDAVNPDKAWNVLFHDGLSDVSPKSAHRHVRLVRNEPAALRQDFTQNDAERVFNWAESVYPAYFSPAKPPVREAQGYIYRHYPNTGLYLAMKNGKLWLVAPSNSSLLFDGGSFSRWLGKAKAAGF